MYSRFIFLILEQPQMSEHTLLLNPVAVCQNLRSKVFFGIRPAGADHEEAGLQPAGGDVHAHRPLPGEEAPNGTARGVWGAHSVMVCYGVWYGMVSDCRRPDPPSSPWYALGVRIGRYGIV